MEESTVSPVALWLKLCGFHHFVSLVLHVTIFAVQISNLWASSANELYPETVRVQSTQTPANSCEGTNKGLEFLLTKTGAQI